MKKIILSIVLLVALVACKTDKNKTEAAVTDEVTVIALNDFESKAGDWVDKEVQLTGIVDHVCKHGGKRLFLVSDEADVHVDSENRFDDALEGSEISVKGIVRELRVDEAYCLQQEEDFIQKHKEGVDGDDVYEKKMAHIQSYRDSMKVAGVDHLSFYTIDYLSHDILK